MSQYLSLPDDAAAFGLPSNVTGEHITRASSIVDSYVRRPEGLVWAPDYSGAPAYMVALKPRLTLKATASIAPGQNVIVPVTPGFNNADAVGEVLILDRANADVTEAVVIVSASQGQITLDNVANEHPVNSLLEMGLVILEERQMPQQRSISRIARPNFARLIAGQGRYGYGRRSDQSAGTFNEVNLLATLATFGGPPQWLPWDITQASVSATTGEIWVPAGMLLAYYTDVRIRYVAGFSADAIPDAIKIACASIATTIATLPPELVSGQVRKIKAGDTDIDRYVNSGSGRGAGVGNTLIDQNSQALLDEYKIRSFY